MPWLAFAAFILIIMVAAVYFLPGMSGQFRAIIDPEGAERLEKEETAVSPEEELEDEDDDESWFEEDVIDPFEEGEEKEVPEEEEARERSEEGPVEAPEDELTGPEDDLDVISNGDYLLALVTKETTLKQDYVPADLEPIPSYMKPSYQMQLRQEALEHLKKLWETAEEDGVTLSIRSAYRSYQTQKQLFKDYASRHGEEEANRFSARPGQSEHQLGTAVDFGGTGADFTAEFARTEQGRWLADNAHRYGFVKSYPAGKEDITGYIYEPWHYRYIGVEHAREWNESGLTLKEYLKKQPQDFE